ncbi:MAG: M48 family metallopeptidase [Hyphomonadaceae bacterium]
MTEAKKRTNQLGRILKTGAQGLLAVYVLTACATSGIVSSDSIAAKADTQWNAILESVPQVQDAEFTNAVRLMTGNLLVAAGEDPAQWQVAVFDAPETFNAFALPNKRIGIFTGLLTTVENSDQLAAVIGHEIAHVQLKHVEARLNRAIAPSILIGVAKLPGALSGVPVLETTGNVVGGVVSAGTVLPYGRDQEIDADTAGITYAFDAGFDPHQAAILWRHVEEKTNEAGTATPEFLSTHPSNARRITALERKAHELTQSE